MILLVSAVFALLPIIQGTGWLAQKIWVNTHIETAEMAEKAETIVVPVSDFSILHPGDEINWRDKKLDIIRCEKTGDFWVLKVYDDKLDHVLSDTAATNQKQSGGNQKSTWILKDWISDRIPQISITDFFGLFPLPEYDDHSVIQIAVVELPPPEFV